MCRGARAGGAGEGRSDILTKASHTNQSIQSQGRQPGGEMGGLDWHRLYDRTKLDGPDLRWKMYLLNTMIEQHHQ